MHTPKETTTMLALIIFLFQQKYRHSILKEETFANKNIRGFAAFGLFSENVCPRNFVKYVIYKIFITWSLRLKYFSIFSDFL